MRSSGCCSPPRRPLPASPAAPQPSLRSQRSALSTLRPLPSTVPRSASCTAGCRGPPLPRSLPSQAQGDANCSACRRWSATVPPSPRPVRRRALMMPRATERFDQSTSGTECHAANVRLLPNISVCCNHPSSEHLGLLQPGSHLPPSPCFQHRSRCCLLSCCPRRCHPRSYDSSAIPPPSVLPLAPPAPPQDRSCPIRRTKNNLLVQLKIPLLVRLKIHRATVATPRALALVARPHCACAGAAAAAPLWRQRCPRTLSKTRSGATHICSLSSPSSSHLRPLLPFARAPCSSR
mmetsp:Transcript_34233/g.81624  ORF Transcript_34233/g.81624 Transcript_34233/m.81624 type:complete len:292 (+) Transcript_34233:2396-3271(+)